MPFFCCKKGTVTKPEIRNQLESRWNRAVDAVIGNDGVDCSIQSGGTIHPAAPATTHSSQTERGLLRRFAALCCPLPPHPFPSDHGLNLNAHHDLITRNELVHLFVNGEDVGCILIREGYARTWRGSREDWCVKTDFKRADLNVDCSLTGAINPR